MDPSPTPSFADDELLAAFERLRLVVAQREQEHKRQQRLRAWAGRGIVLFMLAILGGLVAIGANFKMSVFSTHLEAKVSEGAPGVLRDAKMTVESLAPIYRDEVERTMPKFMDKLSDVISSEAGKMADAIAPLASGDDKALTAEADDVLAKALLAKYPKELKTDADAKALAAALRKEQIAAAPRIVDGPLAGPFGALHDIEMSLRNMGPPDKELMSSGDTIDALGKAAMDVVKARIVSGESFGFGDDKDSKTKKPVVAKGGK